jgi:hypothetical protein
MLQVRGKLDVEEIGCPVIAEEVHLIRALVHHELGGEDHSWTKLAGHTLRAPGPCLVARYPGAQTLPIAFLISA